MGNFYSRFSHQFSISIMGSFFSRFSHRNNTDDGDPTIPPRVSDSVPSLHTIYAYLTGLLLVLIQIKYQGLNTTPFKDHPAVMILFLIAITVYIMALIVLTSDSNLRMVGWILCHVCGSVACELLVLVLVSPLWCFLINASSLVMVLTLLCCYIYYLEAPQMSSDIPSGEAQQATQMTDIEAAETADP